MGVMLYPSAQLSARTFLGLWQSLTDCAVTARLWRVSSTGEADRYEADVARHGEAIDKLSRATHEVLTLTLAECYGLRR